MRRGDAKRVHQPDHVIGHVPQQVGRRHRLAGELALDHGLHADRLEAGDLGRLADVAIVEPDHAKPALRQLLAKSSSQWVIWAASPDDQDQRLGIIGAKHLAAQIEAVGLDGVWPCPAVDVMSVSPMLLKVVSSSINQCPARSPDAIAVRLDEAPERGASQQAA